MLTLRFVEHLPRGRDQNEPTADEGEAQEVKRSKMRVRLPAEQHLEEVPGVVRQPIDLRKAALQPARKEVDRPRKAVHLPDQRHEKGAARDHGAATPGRVRRRSEEGEKKKKH